MNNCIGIQLARRGKKTRVSIIVPAHNEEKYIRKTLQSIRRQTYRNYELIVVDNNSTDATNRIAREYTPRVIREKKKGYHHAVARGVKESRSDILVIGDADTLYPPRWLERIVKEFDNDPTIIGVYGPAKYYDHNIIINFLSQPAIALFLEFSRMRGLHNTLGFNFAVKKKQYIRVGGYNPAIYNDICLDLELGKRLTKTGKLKLARNNRVLTSSRRVKQEGMVRNFKEFIEAWNNLRRGKKQRISYSTYNQIYR